MSRPIVDAAGADKARPCKLRGRKIVLVRDSDGQLHALDAAAEVYTVRRDTFGDPIATPATTAGVDHAALCRGAAAADGRAA